MRRPAERRSRRAGLVALAVVGAMLVPAALALACNPQAYLTLNKSTFTPGETVGVSGSFFKSSVTITVSLDRTGQSQAVTTSPSGSFQVSFTLPGDAPTGGYGVTAVGYEANGDLTVGLPARASFVVEGSAPAAEQPAQPAPGQNAETPSQSAPSTPAGSERPVRPFREPSLQREPDVVRSGRSERSSAPDRAAASPSPQQTATVQGRPVFAGSVSPTATTETTATPVPATPVSGAATEQRADKAAGRRPAASDRSTGPQGGAQQTVADDVWSATDSEGSLSLMPGDGGPAVQGRSSGIGAALALLIVGGTVLFGGLALAGARRRRTR